MIVVRSSGAARIVIATTTLLLIACAAVAQAPRPTEPPSDAKAVDPAAAETASKLSFHAYLNQAYARSDDHQIYGIPQDGTTDYASLAIQFRYQMTGDDLVAVQFGHDRLGRSTLNSVSSDVLLDWAFYQRRLGDATSVKVGRVQLPLGIYNEVQDVGTILPFYTAPQTVYLKSRTTETLDGVMISHAFGGRSGWSVDADFYGGSWDRTEQSASSGEVAEARAENAFGTQLWLNTPLSGVRFGLAALRFDVTGGLIQVNAKDRVTAYVLSYDGTFDRFFTRAELIHGQQPGRLAPFVVTDKLEYLGGYGQIGFAVTPQLKINLQLEESKIDLNFGAGYTLLNRDLALGLSYAFNSSTVVKLEGHRTYGTQSENETLPKPVTTNFGIASLAISF
jgi:hypothetical protein